MQRTWKAATLALVTIVATIATSVPGSASTGPAEGASGGTATVRPAPAPYATWGDLVDRQYGDILDRAPTPVERSTATTALEGSTLAPGQLVADLLARPEHASVVDPAVRLYQAFFLRPPDASGFDFWVARRRAGTWTLVRMAEQFARSSEFRGRYGSLGDGAYVDLVYQNVLGRPADPGGRSFWIGRLQRRATSRGHLMASFSESTEHRVATAARTTTNVVFLHLLGRPPTPDEQASLIEAGSAATEPAKLAGEVLRDHEHLRHVDPTTTAPTLVSVGPDGVTPAGDSYLAGTSDDGTLLAITGDPSRIGFGEGGYLWQRFIGLTALDLLPDGAPSGAIAWPMGLSGDGSTVLYRTLDSTGGSAARVLDLATGATEPLPTTPGATEAPYFGVAGPISDDGSVLTWAQRDGDASQVWVWDRATDAVVRISEDATGDPGNQDSYNPTVSGDGSTVAFPSVATDLGPTSQDPEIYAWDRGTETLEQVTGSPAGATHWSGTGALDVRVSDDGERIALLAHTATGLGASCCRYDLVLIDRTSGTQQRVPDGTGSIDGRDVVALAMDPTGDHVLFQAISADSPSGTGDLRLWSATTGTDRTTATALPALRWFARLDASLTQVAFDSREAFVPGDRPPSSNDDEADVFVLPIPPG